MDCHLCGLGPGQAEPRKVPASSVSLQRALELVILLLLHPQACGSSSPSPLPLKLHSYKKRKGNKNMMFQTTRAAAVSARTGLRRKRQSIRHKCECHVQKHRRKTQPGAFASKQFLHKTLQQTLQVLPRLPSPEGLNGITAPGILHPHMLPRGHPKESRGLRDDWGQLSINLGWSITRLPLLILQNETDTNPWIYCSKRKMKLPDLGNTDGDDYPITWLISTNY